VPRVTDDTDIGASLGHPTFYCVCHTGVRVLGRLCRYRCPGRQNVPAEGPFILASNHISYADPPLLSLATRRPVSFVAKEELFRFRPFGALIGALNAFPVRRGTADRAAIRRAIAVLRAGRGLVIFPEGMRSHDGNLLQPELGIGMIALRSGAPIVPVGLVGTDRVMPRGLPVFLPRRFEVRVGEPLTFPELCAKGHWRREDYEEVAARTMGAIAELLGQSFTFVPHAAGSAAAESPSGAHGEPSGEARSEAST
jgi:1-acyl-sn-glycerol-3-phosphate acyltransferase